MPDVVVVATPTASGAGLLAVVESYRTFLARSEVERFQPHDHVVIERDAAAIVEYRWDMAWRTHGAAHEATGREILVLAHRDGACRIVWRTQLAG